MNKNFYKFFYCVGILVLLVPFSGAEAFPREKLADIAAMNPFSLPTPGQTIRVSVSTDGTQGNNHSVGSSISADGRYVAFASDANNLAPGLTGHSQIFVRDLQTNTTSIVSVNNIGQPGDNNSHFPRISADGLFVAFHSGANNLVSGDPDNFTHVFVRDLQNNLTSRVSVASNSDVANYPSSNPSISADGRYVAFMSSANNLDTRATVLNVFQVYVHDRKTGNTALVSLSHDGKQPNQQSRFPSISADGRYVAFDTFASNMLPGETIFRRHVYIYDSSNTVQTTRVSVSSSGVAGNNASRIASVSEDGRFVAFQSIATNLVTGDTNDVEHVFVRDLHTSQTTRVSVSSTGTQGNGHSVGSSVSANGRFVAFQSSATNLVSVDTNLKIDIFVHDRQTSQTTRASVHTNGAQANGDSMLAAISGDGRLITFSSDANNLVINDTNGKTDIFARRNTIQSTAEFSGSPTSGPAPLTVQFTNLSSGDYNICEWDFGEGVKIYNCNETLSRTYTSAGNYTVSLKVSGYTMSDTETKNNYIIVGGPALPGVFVKTSPPNNALNQPTNPTLIWQMSSGANSYEYCFAETQSCSNWANNGTATSKTLSGLQTNTTYYWHVRAKNSAGTTYANSSDTAFWSFTTRDVVNGDQQNIFLPLILR